MTTITTTTVETTARPLDVLSAADTGAAPALTWGHGDGDRYYLGNSALTLVELLQDLTTVGDRRHPGLPGIVVTDTALTITLDRSTIHHPIRDLTDRADLIVALTERALP